MLKFFRKINISLTNTTQTCPNLHFTFQGRTTSQIRVQKSKKVSLADAANSTTDLGGHFLLRNLRNLRAEKFAASLTEARGHTGTANPPLSRQYHAYRQRVVRIFPAGTARRTKLSRPR